MKKNLTTLALCFELPTEVPDWVELIPPGPEVAGIDGRSWLNDQPQMIIDHFNHLKNRHRDLPIDYEHASELKAPNGDPAPAAAWATELEVRDGNAIWAKVEWTPKGRESVANREYRYLSPVLIYEKVSGRIVGLSSAALTNKPNLALTALNRAVDGGETNNKETMMKKVYSVLKLAEAASEDEVVAAITTLQQDLATASNRAETPSLAKFVPREDYDTALARATNAETALASHKKAELETAIGALVDAALKAGKITPATKEYHLASCREEGGLERFRDFVKVAPTVADNDGRTTGDPADQGKALNTEEAQVAAMFGNSADDIKKYGA